MKRTVTLCLLIFFVFAAFEIAGTTSASAVTSEIMEKAKKEGKVVWYTTMPGSGRKAVKKAFEKEYPLKLERKIGMPKRGYRYFGI